MGFPGFPATEKPGFFYSNKYIGMKHPNRSFLAKFLGIEKQLAEQQKKLARKKEIIQFFENKEKNKKIKTLTEDNKNCITKILNRVPKKLLAEQKTYNGEWTPITTDYGIFYFNEQENIWMNTFGVVKDSLNDFIGMFDHDADEKSSREKEIIPDPPSDLQISNITEDGTFKLSWVDNVLTEEGFVIYVSDPKE